MIIVSSTVADPPQYVTPLTTVQFLQATLLASFRPVFQTGVV